MFDEFPSLNSNFYCFKFLLLVSATVGCNQKFLQLFEHVKSSCPQQISLRNPAMFRGWQMSQCFTSPNYWGYKFQQIFGLVMWNKSPKRDIINPWCLDFLWVMRFCPDFSWISWPFSLVKVAQDASGPGPALRSRSMSPPGEPRRIRNPGGAGKPIGKPMGKHRKTHRKMVIQPLKLAISWCGKSWP